MQAERASRAGNFIAAEVTGGVAWGKLHSGKIACFFSSWRLGWLPPARGHHFSRLEFFGSPWRLGQCKKSPVMRRFPLSLIVLASLLVVFRLLSAAYSETLPNVQPLPALLLCSLVFLDGKWRWLLPVGVWAITDPVVSLLQGSPAFGWHHAALLLGVGATVAMAAPLRRTRSAAWLLGGSVAAALLFYFLTNTVSFLSLPLYQKSLAGFIEAQWSGPAGFGPTWLFLRNSLAANLLFSGLFVLAHRPWRGWVIATAPAA
jgi:hypothetical protein